MGLKIPRGKYERLDVILPSKVWRTEDRMDPPVAATCRNISARGCRFVVEDAKVAPNFDVDVPIYFSIDFSPWKPNRERSGALLKIPQQGVPKQRIEGRGQVAWLKREHGEQGKVRLSLGIQYTAVSFDDRELIKEYITSHTQV